MSPVEKRLASPRRSFRALTLVLLTTIVARAFAASNVLLISIDDLRPELGCYGAAHIVSPNLDRLAKTGLLFERAFCQETVCTPSRASLFTGLRPDSVGVWDLRTSFRRVRPDVVTLPELFRRNGYATESLGKTLWPDDPRSWSENTFSPPVPGTRPASPASKYANAVTRAEVQAEYDAAVAAGLTGVRFERAARGPAFEQADVPDEAYDDGRLARAAVESLRRNKTAGRPFFLAVGFQKPHLPFNAPQKYWDLYARKDLPKLENAAPVTGVPWYAIGRNAEFRGYDGVPAGPVDDPLASTLRRGYYACVSYVDTQVGKVMDEVDRLGLSGDTIVVVWSDHGFKLGEHGGWGKSSQVEEDTRVPLIIRIPGQRNAGARTRALVELVDVFPTLVASAALQPPKGLEGTSLLPLFADPARPWKSAAFSQYPRNTKEDELAAGTWDLMGRTIRTESFRLTRWEKVGRAGEIEAVELYDHRTDPAENSNMAGKAEYASTVESLSRRLDQGWRAALPP